jgi:Skp family chaperone for outer membrane proteins
MKKTILILSLALAVIACEKKTETKEFKTAYIDTAKLMEESTEAKDIEAKYKDKSKVMGSQLEAEVSKFQSEAANFRKMHKQMVWLGLNKRCRASKKGTAINLCSTSYAQTTTGRKRRRVRFSS